LGTVLVFTALFRPMWRGDCFEFVFNNVFWSYISMLLVFFIFKKMHILKRAPEVAEQTEEDMTAAYIATQ
jgi:hypothetical protein